MTYAEMREELGLFAGRRYREMLLLNVRKLMEGGRAPGMAVGDRDERLAFYEQSPPEYWRTLAATNALAYKQQRDEYLKLLGLI